MQVAAAATAGKTFSKIDSAQWTSFILMTDGTVIAWGSFFTATPTAIPMTIITSTGRTIVDIAGGGGCVYALTNDGVLYASGYNVNRGLGDGTTITNTSFVLSSSVMAALICGERIINIYGGGSPNGLITTNYGRLLAWGDNSVSSQDYVNVSSVVS